MGQIYRVKHSLLNKFFAMKTLDSNRVSETAWRRLQVEAQAIARLSHPNIVGIYNFGLHHNQTPYYVMDLLTGQNLASIIKAHGAMETREALAIFLEVCQGLAFAHRKGIVHRDIKPSNIMVLHERGVDGAIVKLVDFGIAKLTAVSDPKNQNLTNAGEVFGSPYYMSPEQCMGQPVDERSDIYSLGCALFEALVGRPPFVGETSIATVFKHQEEPAPSLQTASGGRYFPDALEKIVATLLAKEPSQRYQNLDKVAADLERLYSSKSSLGTAPNKKAHLEIFERDTTTQNTTTQNQTFVGQANKTIFVAFAAAGILLVSSLAALSFYFNKGPSAGSDVTSAANSVNAATVNGASAAGASGEVAKYSKICNEGQSIQFDFPVEYSIGKIGTRPTFSKMVEATGTMVFPAKEKLYFLASDHTMSEPQVLSRFNPSDLYSFAVPFDAIGGSAKKVLPYVSQFKDLRILKLESSNVCDDQIELLNKLTKLEYLNVSFTDITGSGLAKFSGLKKLRELYFNGNRETSQLLKKLAGSENLISLGVEKSEQTLTAVDLANIASCRKLTYVDLMQTGVTDSAIAKLFGMPKLQVIDVSKCPVSDKTLRALQSATGAKIYIRP